MKKRIQNLLQKMLGFENYLYYFSRFMIFTARTFAYEMEFSKFIKLVPPGDNIILDIGANIGITSVVLAKKFPGSTIHAFEPIPPNISTVKRIIKHYKLKNVQLHETALGEKEGSLKMVVPVINNVRMQGLSHAYVEGNDEDWNKGDIYYMEMMKLDDVIALKGDKKIVAIKMDVENFEYHVLRGSIELLKKHKPVIYCELWNNEMRQLAISLLKDIGYTIQNTKGKKFENSADESFADFIFVHPDNKK
ncbi:MAG TPA: FkbM family methyltransferase [Puia sp.]